LSIQTQRGVLPRGALLACVFSSFAANITYGQEVAEIPFFHAPAGSAALGGGLRTGASPYFSSGNEDERKSDLVPLYLYQGKYLFARGTSGGLHVFRNDALELNLYTRYRFQRLDPNRDPFYEGLEERRQSLDAGIELGLTQPWGELKLDWVADTLDRHNGQEVRASYRYRWDLGPWSISPFIAWNWQNDNLSNYYFGVSEAEATAARPAYAPGQAEWVSWGMNTSWQVTDRIVLFGNVAFIGGSSEITDSPLVEEDSYSSVFVGGTYMFGNARQPDYLIDPERSGEWSWRVNYGYQANGNIVSEIDQGDFSKSDVADTNIGGLTFSKLLGASERVDFLGRVAWFRHYEEDEGNGTFSSYAAYIMAMGKGYSQWSGDELFRWGFGFGMSYAEKVPIVEQRKQASKGDNTAHFLNYLEMTLDFPLRRVSKANWLQNCYAGVTVVHRSGIFGTSDLLGNVSGGSDWITAHLECTR
jgi:outer membrane scaffolding protein for murein synthesis (MipA/OmpV family)